jgi:hypothetical protein
VLIGHGLTFCSQKHLIEAQAIINFKHSSPALVAEVWQDIIPAARREQPKLNYELTQPYKHKDTATEVDHGGSFLRVDGQLLQGDQTIRIMLTNTGFRPAESVRVLVVKRSMFPVEIEILDNDPLKNMMRLAENFHAEDRSVDFSLEKTLTLDIPVLRQGETKIITVGVKAGKLSKPPDQYVFADGPQTGALEPKFFFPVSITCANGPAAEIIFKP